MTSPVKKSDKAYMKEQIYPLALWKEVLPSGDHRFMELKDIAEIQGDLLVERMLIERDKMVRGAGGKLCHGLQGFGVVKQPMADGVVESLGKLFEGSIELKTKLDEVVLVPLLRLQA